MAHTYEELKGMTVARLREIAEGIDHEALHGYSTMHKEHLLPALCEALGIEAHEHHEIVGVDKTNVKRRIRALRAERDTAYEKGDGAAAAVARRQIKRLKRRLRRARV